VINWISSIVAPHIIRSNYHNVCEIGSSTGATSEKLLQLTDIKISIVDPCLDEDLDQKFAHTDRVTIHKGLSLDVLPGLSETFDCIIIDGDHNWYTVFHELEVIHNRQLLSKGGTIFFHDVGWPYGRRDMYYSLETIPPQYVNSHSRGGVIRGQSELTEHLSWPVDVARFEGGPRNGVLTAIEDFAKLHGSEYELCVCPSVEAGLGVLWKKDHSSTKKSFNEVKKSLFMMSLRTTSPASILRKFKPW
jgi:hypothetical protein